MEVQVVSQSKWERGEMFADCACKHADRAEKEKPQREV